MKSLIQSKFDKPAFVIQIITILGVGISGLIDPSFWIFGAIFTTPISVIILLYFIDKALYLRGNISKIALRGLFTSLFWVITTVSLLYYLLDHFTDNFMNLG